MQKHNPAAFFANSRNAECDGSVWKGWNRDAPPPPPDQLLPANGVAFIIPGQDHNGHNGKPDPDAKVQAWNNWLRDNIGSGRPDGNSYVAYAQNPANKTLLIITQDEKSGSYCGDKNHIILFLISGDLTPRINGVQVGDPNGPTAAQYNILRTITQNFGLPDLGNANATVPALIPALQ